MIFEKLEIQNFGPFSGNFKIRLPNGDKKIVVVHGKNGSGKTTIARAFLWTLYGVVDVRNYTSKGNQSPDDKLKKIINTRTIHETGINENIDVSVTITFSHGNTIYEVTRSLSAMKISELEVDLIEKDKLKVLITPRSGSTSLLENKKAQQAIAKVLPESMADYFFFKGELMEKLSMPTHSKRIKNAIETVFGFNIIYDLKGHLQKTENIIYEKQEKEAKANQHLEKLSSMRADTNSKLQEQRELKETMEKEIKIIEQNISKKETYLDERKEIAKEQAEKRDYVNKINEYKELNKIICKRIDDELISTGFLFFSNDLYEHVEPILLKAKEEGKIPSSIVSPQVVNKVLKNEKCICGTPLVKGSKEEKNLTELINTTYRGDLEKNFDVFRDVGSQVKAISDKVKISLRNNYSDLTDNLSSIDELEENISYLEEKLKDHQDINIADEQRQIEDLRYEKLDLEQQLHSIKMEVESLEREIDEINLKIKKEESKSGIVGKWSKMNELVQAIKKHIDSFLEEKIDSTRKDFETKLNEVYKRIHTKPYHIQLTENFEMIICETKDGRSQPVPTASEGEFKITSLTFITSLIEFAKNISEEKKRRTGIKFGGGNYSLVIDAPFGDLDSEYRVETARALCNMDAQVILLLSDTHWDENVSNVMAPHKNKEFIITHIGSKSDVPFGKTEYYYRKKGSQNTDEQYCTLEEIL